MRRLLWLVPLIVCTVDAQQIGPHTGYVYPAGGQAGSTITVTVGGQFLDGVNSAFLSGSGVTAEVVDHFKPINNGQFTRLRDQLKEITDKKPSARTDADRKKAEEIAKKLATVVRRPAAPSIVEQVHVKLFIAPDAVLGAHELRLGTPAGLTNPLVFYVGQLPERSKKAAKVKDELQNQRYQRYRPEDTPDKGPWTVTLPTTVNGQIDAGGIDKYKFQATKGQKLVFSAAARQLIPYISDAVPGWFQATLGLYDARHNEIQYAGSFRFHQDPALYCEIPADGEYTLEIKDSIFRGREDFVYRITMGELPFITSVYPLGGKVGSKAVVDIDGWNLPATRLSPALKTHGVIPISVKKTEFVSNEIPFAVDTLPEKSEHEPNNLPKNAMKVKLPVILNGRIDKPGDADVFRIDAKAGEEIVAEVYGRRLDSPIDSTLRLTDSQGKELAVNDDFEDKSAGLITHHADSRIAFKTAKNGSYYLCITDAQNKGGAEYAYRLRIGHPQPDFELRMTPSTVNVRGGGTVLVTVYAIRRDGFTGDINLKLKDVPPGFVLRGGWVPANQDKVRLTLTVPPKANEQPYTLRVEGKASIGGRDVTHTAVPAEDMMQAFYYHHLVPQNDLLVRVLPAGRTSRQAWNPPAEKVVKLPRGGTYQVHIPLPRVADYGQFRFTLSEPPDGLAIQKVTPGKDGVDLLLHADNAKTKPGLKGNLIVDAFVERAGNTGSKKKGSSRQGIGTLPAIPFEVVN